MSQPVIAEQHAKPRVVARCSRSFAACIAIVVALAGCDAMNAPAGTPGSLNAHINGQAGTTVGIFGH
jgi:hypothetical protein